MGLTVMRNRVGCLDQGQKKGHSSPPIHGQRCGDHCIFHLLPIPSPPWNVHKPYNTHESHESEMWWLSSAIRSHGQAATVHVLLLLHLAMNLLLQPTLLYHTVCGNSRELYASRHPPPCLFTLYNNCYNAHAFSHPLAVYPQGIQLFCNPLIWIQEVPQFSCDVIHFRRVRG